jgi:hypothetical protein
MLRTKSLIPASANVHIVANIIGAFAPSLPDSDALVTQAGSAGRIQSDDGWQMIPFGKRSV